MSIMVNVCLNLLALVRVNICSSTRDLLTLKKINEYVKMHVNVQYIKTRRNNSKRAMKKKVSRHVNTKIIATV